MQTLFQLPEPRKDLLNPLLKIYGQAEPGLKCIPIAIGSKHLCHFLQINRPFVCGIHAPYTGDKEIIHQPIWQACSFFQSLDPSCTRCSAKRLENCICESRNHAYRQAGKKR